AALVDNDSEASASAPPKRCLPSTTQSPQVWDFLCFKSSFSRCSALQSTLAALRISILRQRSSSNIHAGSSNGLAFTLFSLRHRRIPSPCFSRSSWIQTARPYQGCHRYRTSWDSILWVFDCELVQSVTPAYEPRTGNSRPEYPEG